MLTNRSSRTLIRTAVTLGTAFALTACLHLDHFASKATDFNLEVAQAQDRTLMLNILRAANRFPMHFTELSTLSGTGTVTAGGTLTLPFATLNGGMNTFSAAPTATMSESPTFNIAVLETQEFYRGMLASISPEQIANYVQEGLQPELVFTLAFGQIIYQSSPTSKPITIENNFHPLALDKRPYCPDTARSEYDCFKAILRAMIARHVTTEQLHQTKNLGPFLSSAAFADLKWTAGYDPKTIKVATITKEDCETSAAACPGGEDELDPQQHDLLYKRSESLYRLQQDDTESRLCFDEPTHQLNRLSTATDIASRITDSPIPDKLICRSRVDDSNTKNSSLSSSKHLLFEFSEPPPATLPDVDKKSKGKQPKSGFTLQVRARSTEGVIYYLGEIGRCQLKLDPLSICSNVRIHVPYRPAPDDEDKFFEIKKVVRKGPTAAANDAVTPPRNQYMVAEWQGDKYEIFMDPSGQDRSGQVLRVLTQLLALNRSAKDFPTPAVVPIISR